MNILVILLVKIGYKVRAFSVIFIHDSFFFALKKFKLLHYR